MRRWIILAHVLMALWVAAPAWAAPPGRAAILEDVRVNGPVEGDVVTIGGDVVLGPRAHVTGHAVSIFGRVEMEPGARVEGRSLAVGSLAGLSIETGGGAADHRAVWGLRMLVAGCWLTVTTVLALAFPRRIIRGEWLVRRTGVGGLGLGVLATVTLFAALVAVVGLGGGFAVPGTLAVAGLYVGLKVLGMAVLGGTVGRWVLRRAAHRVAPMPTMVFLGATVLVLGRLVPVVGGVLWAVVSIWGVGAAVTVLAMDPARLLTPAESHGPE